LLKSGKDSKKNKKAVLPKRMSTQLSLINMIKIQCPQSPHVDSVQEKLQVATNPQTVILPETHKMEEDVEFQKNKIRQIQERHLKYDIVITDSPSMSQKEDTSCIWTQRPKRQREPPTKQCPNLGTPKAKKLEQVTPQFDGAEAQKHIKKVIWEIAAHFDFGEGLGSNQHCIIFDSVISQTACWENVSNSSKYGLKPEDFQREFCSSRLMCALAKGFGRHKKWKLPIHLPKNREFKGYTLEGLSNPFIAPLEQRKPLAKKKGGVDPSEILVLVKVADELSGCRFMFVLSARQLLFDEMWRNKWFPGTSPEDSVIMQIFQKEITLRNFWTFQSLASTLWELDNEKCIHSQSTKLLEWQIKEQHLDFIEQYNRERKRTGKTVK
jgi:hypothetical protein